jgi:hypothetical protein
MLLSICVLGYGDIAREFVKKYKNLNYYKISDSDTLGVRVHAVHVLDNKNSKYSGVSHTYDSGDGDFFSVLKDGTEESNKETPFGSDAGWLLETDGHRTVVEFSDGDAAQYLEVLKGQIKKHFDVHITTPEIAAHREELKSLAEEVGASIYFYSGDDVVDTLMEYLESKYQSEKEKKLTDETGACGLEDKVDWSKY